MAFRYYTALVVVASTWFTSSVTGLQMLLAKRDTRVTGTIVATTPAPHPSKKTVPAVPRLTRSRATAQIDSASGRTWRRMRWGSSCSTWCLTRSYQPRCLRALTHSLTRCRHRPPVLVSLHAPGPSPTNRTLTTQEAQKPAEVTVTVKSPEGRQLHTKVKPWCSGNHRRGDPAPCPS